jgi:hypothetical protein
VSGLTLSAAQLFALRYQNAVARWIEFYWPAEVSRKWLQAGYRPGTYGAAEPALPISATPQSP